MWKSFENVGLQTSEKVSWGKKTCAKHKIDRSRNGRSNNNNKVAVMADMGGRRSSFYYRDWQKKWLSAQRIREKRRFCTNASQWRFNATITPCVLQTLLFTIRRNHSGHYHHLRHHRRRYNNNNNNNRGPPESQPFGIASGHQTHVHSVTIALPVPLKSSVKITVKSHLIQWLPIS